MSIHQDEYPILEYDDSPIATIEPSKILSRLPDMPERVVLCFFQDVMQSIFRDAPVFHFLGSEIGRNPIYLLEQNGQKVAVTHAGVGASLSGTFLEELIAFGGRQFVACGGSGVLNREIAVGHVIVPNQAIRDEGTSYHYLPPAREVSADAQVIKAIQQTLERHSVPYLVGKTWTTDAPYRETPAKIARRKAEGCLTVEMEAAAFFAIAQFRNVQFGQILYGGDDISGEEWDTRDWHKQSSTREKLFWLAVESAIGIEADARP